MKKETNDGFERFVELFPTNKRKGENDALVTWSGFSQAEKKQVMRHAVVYTKNTNPHFLKQIGNYIKDRDWENLSKEHYRKDNPMYNKKELLDGNFVMYFQRYSDSVTFDEAKDTLAELDKDTLMDIYNLYLDFRNENTQSLLLDNLNLVTKEIYSTKVIHAVDNQENHYLCWENIPYIKYNKYDWQRFVDNLKVVFTNASGEQVYKDITPQQITYNMLHSLTQRHQALYGNDEPALYIKDLPK